MSKTIMPGAVAFVGLTTKSGTAASETVLCRQHDDRAGRKLARAEARGSAKTCPAFVDVSENDAAECIVCGATPETFS